MALAAGDRLGPYEILAPLGAGRRGEVYKARDTRLGREVAIRVSNAEFSGRFTREARLIATLHHPHICTLHEIGPNYLVMEFIDGVPLKGPLPQAEALDFATQIADALDHAHQHGIAHGALEPSNILVTGQGIKLLDFGLASIADGPDARSDIHAFGCVLYEMLMGRPVQEGRRRVDPPALEGVLAKCLDPDPARRYPSVSELKPALAVAQKGRSFKREYVFVVVAVVSLIAGLGLLMMEFPSRQRLTDKDVLVLSDFHNTTGDAMFDGTLRAALAIELKRSPFLKILGDEQVQQDLKLMGRPADSRITPAIAHDICVREGQKAMIGGSIADLGKTFAITVQVVNCRNGATLAREQVQAEGREQVFRALSKAAMGIRAKLGEPLSSIQKADR
jgi:predicted Ser/Thr protein kinase